MEQLSAAITSYTKTNKGHVAYEMEVRFRGEVWSLAKRFNDFADLHHSLMREHSKLLLRELPPKRFWGRFDPNFLEERMHDLQTYLDDTLIKVPVTESQAIVDFLEIPSHVPWELRARNLSEEGGRRVELEGGRLAALVEETAKALIDVSRVGLEPQDDEFIASQRYKLLKACDGFRAHEKHLRGFFQQNLPKEASSVKTVDGLVDSLQSRPAVALIEQRQLLERVGMAIVDQLRAGAKIKVAEGEDLCS